jgi:hypothetical protein
MIKGSETAMGKYPDQSCRNCSHADWTWSRKRYPEGRRRIIIQQWGRCRAEFSLATQQGSQDRLEAMRPFTDCQAWTEMTAEQLRDIARP